MKPGNWERLIGWFLDNRFFALLLGLFALAGGLYVSPLAGETWWPRDPVPVDAIPDIGENQQIVFTEWVGRSPRDVEDQITYPLTAALLGMPGVRTVRSSSAFGFSTIYVIFHDDVEFYWSRSRILEKLASLPRDALPPDAVPTLGPDATALGQIFWYTIEGRDAEGRTTGGWDADELRSTQDWTVRHALASVEGVSEVASVGGFVREYQVDVDPEALRAHDVTLSQVANAVRGSNLDVGARTMEINGVEYVVRGVGFVKRIADLEAAVVVARDHVPIRLRDVARVTTGPALRRGALDDEGAPAVGGVVVARFMENPRAVIAAVKQKIAQIAPGLPRRTLEDGRESQLTIVPFYDRTTLIDETLGTLSTALYQQILITLIVVLLMMRRLSSSLLLSGLLPLGVLLAFVAMKLFGVDANVMALGGIAIAIGTMVDIGIVFVTNAYAQLRSAGTRARPSLAVRRSAAEVAPAVLTSVLTTLVSFLPVLGLSSTELRLFAPLVYAKTFAIVGAFILAVTVLPAATLLVARRRRPTPTRAGASFHALTDALSRRLPRSWRRWAAPLLAALLVSALLAESWVPLGRPVGSLINALFVAALLALLMGTFLVFERFYPRLLEGVLAHKLKFALLPLAVLWWGAMALLGFDQVFAFLPTSVRQTAPVARWAEAFPGLGREYMPPFDEGSFLYMPSTMPHASMAEVLTLLSETDAAIAQIPEVDRVVGKLGRVNSALDPAPLSMLETLVTYHPEYRTDESGLTVRNWRDHVRSPQDIWDEIVRVAQRPGLTSAPKLMPIGARLVMLQSGMRAPLGVKVRGPSLQAIEAFGLELEKVLEAVPSIRPETVFADRVVGKPYVEIHLDREGIARHGLSVVDVQRVLRMALGGIPLTTTVEGRERYAVRVRYMRERRDSIEALRRIFVPMASGENVPLDQLARIEYVRGPQVIRSEDTFLTSYVLFDHQPGVAEVETVQDARAAIQARLERGSLDLPAGVSFEFAGSYANQVRSEKRLALLIPVALSLVLGLLYLQFKRVSTSLIIYSGVLVAVAGGFGLLWLYGQPSFLDFSLAGRSMRDLFQVRGVNLSVAVWIGFIALVGIATDDGVLMCTYLRQRFERDPPRTRQEVRDRTREAGARRLRPCLMTTATTLLALLPVLSSRGKGADIMMPMALPAVGGMAVELLTLFVVPALYCAHEEWRLGRARVGLQPKPAGSEPPG